MQQLTRRVVEEENMAKKNTSYNITGMTQPAARISKRKASSHKREEAIIMAEDKFDGIDISENILDSIAGGMTEIGRPTSMRTSSLGRSPA